MPGGEGREGGGGGRRKKKKEKVERPSDSKDGCFTLKTWKVKTTVEQRLYSARFQRVQACAGRWLDRAQGSPGRMHKGGSPRLSSSLMSAPPHPPSLFPSADHQRPEAACDCGGHAADRPVHPDLLAGCGPPAEDSGEVQHGGERPGGGGGRHGGHSGDIRHQGGPRRLCPMRLPPKLHLLPFETQLLQEGQIEGTVEQPVIILMNARLREEVGLLEGGYRCNWGDTDVRAHPSEK